MNKTTLLDFPCEFPVKIIGTNSNDFLEEIKSIVARHFPNWTDESLSINPSKNANYLAITATVPAENQQQLDAFYIEISSNPHVKMVL